MWDVYFQQSEPFYLFFLSLVMVINAKLSFKIDSHIVIVHSAIALCDFHFHKLLSFYREQIMSLETGSRDDLVEMLTNMPSQLEHDDVPDFCGLAHYYGLKTPSSFRKVCGIMYKFSNCVIYLYIIYQYISFRIFGTKCLEMKHFITLCRRV